MKSLKLSGFKCFKKAEFEFKDLEIIIGANGSGKSSLFDFLRFLRGACEYGEIPPEILKGQVGQNIFYASESNNRFRWKLYFDYGKLFEPLQNTFLYEGELMGPVGLGKIISERLSVTEYVNNELRTFNEYLRFEKDSIEITDLGKKIEWSANGKKGHLFLGTITDPSYVMLYLARNYIRNWRFYSSFNINNDKIRRPSLISEKPQLDEDCGNLSSVLFYLMTEHPEIYKRMQDCLKSAIPGFKRLSVKARGAPGEVLAFWEENNLDNKLTVADLSDGILRFLCWAVLCVHPKPPTLICIDEPDQGVHPRTLPIIASLLKEASSRTQVIAATHASYFLTQFDIENIAVMKKEGGECKYYKPENNKALMANLEDFGREEIELMHRNDELEALL
ncbi:MAG: AAA family ATPase [Candidatus Eremiobacteraeota bacterium]|nr:AAA family ATPase [Candidatus Eremiobacteraeota bacterium]